MDGLIALVEARRAGLTVEAAGDKLRVRGPRRLESLALQVLAYKPEVMHLLHPDHELSLEERVALGYVNPGWAPEAWAARLRQLGDRCEVMYPDLALQYRKWAGNIERQWKGPP